MTNQISDYQVIQNGYLGGPVTFRVQTAAGDVLPEPKYSPGVITRGMWTPAVPPHGQVKFLETLNGAYTLTNGTYSITGKFFAQHAERDGNNIRAAGKAEVDSGPAQIRIEQAP